MMFENDWGGPDISTGRQDIRYKTGALNPSLYKDHQAVDQFRTDLVSPATLLRAENLTHNLPSYPIAGARLKETHQPTIPWLMKLQVNGTIVSHGHFSKHSTKLFAEF